MPWPSLYFCRYLSPEVTAPLRPWLRLLLLLVLPFAILALVMLGVHVHDTRMEAGAFLSPARPAAGQMAEFAYQLKAPEGAPVQDTDVTVTITKTARRSPLWYVSYLRDDNGAVGLIFSAKLHTVDGWVRLQPLLWDAGEYRIRLEAGGQATDLPVTVLTPLNKSINTVLLYAVVLLAGVFTGRIAATMRRPDLATTGGEGR